MKILLAVDGSDGSTNAARKLAEFVPQLKETPSVEVLTMHLPVPNVPRMNIVVPKAALDRYYAEECAAMAASAQQVLEKAGVKYTLKMRVGAIAEGIVAEASDSGCDMVYLGTHGRTAIANLMMGSIATRVVHLSKVPVVVVR
jgi:nucleotide-binding universal stress UspA family protein